MKKSKHETLIGIVIIAVMIALIKFVPNESALALAYLVLIAAALGWRHQKGDLHVFLTGAVLLFCSEYFFILTGVEKFSEHSLAGVMPLWLPILWGYAFVVIRRILRFLEAYLK